MTAIKDMPMPRNCYECWFEDANRCYLNILQRIESLDRPEWCPLVEITEPKCGHWEGDGQCSACKEYPLARYMKNPNYCPNCGAKMDEPQEAE